MNSLRVYGQLMAMMAFKVKNNITDLYGYYAGTREQFTVDRLQKIVVDGDEVSLPSVGCMQKLKLYLSPPTLVSDEYGFNIYVGNSWNASNKKTLEEYNIERVMNISFEVPNFHEGMGIDYRRYSIRDVSDQEVDFKTLEDFCRECIEDKKNVLIHCFMGASRSVLVCMVVLFILSEMHDEKRKSIDQIYENIFSKRRLIHINKAFFKKWKEYRRSVEKKSD